MDEGEDIIRLAESKMTVGERPRSTANFPSLTVNERYQHFPNF